MLSFSVSRVLFKSSVEAFSGRALVVPLLWKATQTVWRDENPTATWTPELYPIVSIFRTVEGNRWSSTITLWVLQKNSLSREYRDSFFCCCLKAFQLKSGFWEICLESFVELKCVIIGNEAREEKCFSAIILKVSHNTKTNSSL